MPDFLTNYDSALQTITVDTTNSVYVGVHQFILYNYLSYGLSTYQMVYINITSVTNADLDSSFIVYNLGDVDNSFTVPDFSDYYSNCVFTSYEIRFLSIPEDAETDFIQFSDRKLSFYTNKEENAGQYQIQIKGMSSNLDLYYNLTLSVFGCSVLTL